MTTPDPIPIVDADAFREAMATTVDTLRVFSDAVRGVAPRHGHQPSATSRGMAEIAAEAHDYSKRSAWTTPITDTHTFGAMTLFAASDYVGTFAAAIDATPTPVYGHLAVARAALEACVVAAWLNDPDLGVPQRVKRGLCEQLYNADELVRLKFEADPKVRLDHWKGVATQFGWPVTWDRGKPVVDEERRPSIPAGIARLLGDDAEAQIGRVQWSYLSAVSHVTWYGLRQALSDPPTEQAVAAPSLVAVGTASSSVRAQAACILVGLRKAATSTFTLMGWADAEWEAARRRAEAHERALIAPAAGQ